MIWHFMNDSKSKLAFGAPVFLVGFMAAGKSTAGRALAQKLSFQFVDLDDKIEARAQKTVREIFAEFGESHFRQLEREAIQACGELKNTIIALGGGAYVAEENRTILRTIGTTVWLDCPLDVCLSRIIADGSRPLAKSEEEMRELLNKRLPAYSQANIRLEVDKKSAEQIAEEIIAILSS
jgi:shikimate kinase